MRNNALSFFDPQKAEQPSDNSVVAEFVNTRVSEAEYGMSLADYALSMQPGVLDPVPQQVSIAPVVQIRAEQMPNDPVLTIEQQQHQMAVEARKVADQAHLNPLFSDQIQDAA